MVLPRVGSARGRKTGQGSYSSIYKGGLCNLWGVKRKLRVLRSRESLSKIKAVLEWEHKERLTEWGGRGQCEMLMAEVLQIITLLETMRSRMWP